MDDDRPLSSSRALRFPGIPMDVEDDSMSFASRPTPVDEKKVQYLKSREQQRRFGSSSHDIEEQEGEDSINEELYEQPGHLVIRRVHHMRPEASFQGMELRDEPFMPSSVTSDGGIKNERDGGGWV